MNVPKLEELASWLEAGAPHIIFDMETCQLLVKDANRAKILVDSDAVMTEVDKKGLGGCGTICCIAGYVAFMANNEKLFIVEGESKWDGHWVGVRDIALRELDLPSNGEDERYGHDLFSPYLCPENCSPKQAAKAVRLVVDGNHHPWNEIKNEEDE